MKIFFQQNCENLILTIKKNKYFLGTILEVIIPLFWFLNFTNGKNILINVFLFISYFALNGFYLGLILKKYLKIRYFFILGILAIFYLISFALSIPIVFYKIAPLYLFIILAIIGIILSLSVQYLFKDKQYDGPSRNTNSGNSNPIPLWWKISFLILFLASLFVLLHSRTSSIIRSPWQEIHPLYIYGYIGLIILVLYLIKLKPKFKIFIFFVILLSLLAHSYVIFPYEAGFGGDKWRHLGAEQWLMEGNIYSPSLFGEKISYKQLGPLKIPEVFLIGNKTSYANLWAGVINLSWLLNISPFWIDIFLCFILSSIFLPFFLYELGKKVFKKREAIYFFILAPLFFFPFQLYGSLTVPTFFGFILFCFSLLLLFSLYQFACREKLSLKYFFLALILPCLFLYFNYVLYLILYLMVFILFIFFYRLLPLLNRSLSTILLIILICFMAIVFPCLDVASGYSQFKSEKLSGTTIKNFGHNLLFSLPIFYRENGFEQDSWLYSGIEENLSSSIFSQIIKWNYFFTPIFWLITIIGFFSFYFWQSKKEIGLIFSLLIIILISQFIGSSFLEGSCLFSKRLILVFSFFLFFSFAAGLSWVVFKKEKLFIFLIIFLGLFSGSSYISGPKFEAVTGNELKAVSYIWQNLKSEDGPYCVIGNTWPLLALEGVSGRQIIAGGFPVYQEYKQPERVQLFENLNSYPHINDFNKALEITGASSCYFMTEERWIRGGKKDIVFNNLKTIIGEPFILGDIYIWHYQ